MRLALCVLGLLSLACGIPDVLQRLAEMDRKSSAEPPAFTTIPTAVTPTAMSGQLVRDVGHAYTITCPSAFPVATSETMNIPTAIGDVATTLYTACQEGGTCVMVNGATYPDVAFTGQDTQTMLNGARDGAIANVGATKTSEAAVTVGGFPGLSFDAVATMSGITFYVRALIVLRRPHLVMVQWLGTEPESRAAVDANAFFASLLLDPT